MASSSEQTFPFAVFLAFHHLHNSQSRRPTVNRYPCVKDRWTNSHQSSKNVVQFHRSSCRVARSGLPAYRCETFFLVARNPRSARETVSLPRGTSKTDGKTKEH
jgi:hypothetical protein